MIIRHLAESVTCGSSRAWTRSSSRWRATGRRDTSAASRCSTPRPLRGGASASPTAALARAPSACRCCRRCAGAWPRCRCTSTTPTGSTTPTSTSTTTCARSRSPAPGTDRQLAEQVARIHVAPARPAPAAVGALRHPGLQDGNVAVLTKIHHALIDGISGAEIMGLLLDLDPGGPELPDASLPEGETSPERARDARRAACSGCRAIRCARCARLPAALPNIEDTPLRHAARRGDPRAHDGARRRAWPGARARPGAARRPQGAAHDVQRPVSRAPPLRLRAALARRGQGGQERARLHRQRRRRLDLRRRGAPLAGRARRAARASRSSPRSRSRCAARTRSGTYGNRILLMARRCSPTRPTRLTRLQLHPRGAARDEGAPPRAARRAAPGRQQLHPAGGLLPRGAGSPSA